MTTSKATATRAAPLEGVLIAATLAMCGSAIGRVVLQVVFDVLGKRDSSIGIVTWLLGGVSLRFFVAHALAAEAFMMAYPRLPTVRHQLEREKGTLVVGGILGTVMWVVLRALIPIAGPSPAGITLVSWLTMALFSGPLVVWVAQQFVASGNLNASSQDARREIGRGLAVILPALFVLICTFGTDAGNSLMVGIVFVGFAAVALMVVGTSMLLGGISKARGRTNQRWARATPYLIALVAIMLAMALAR